MENAQLEIITEKRSTDWIAYLKGRVGVWESGMSEDHAISKLLFTLFRAGRLFVG